MRSSLNKETQKKSVVENLEESPRGDSEERLLKAMIDYEEHLSKKANIQEKPMISSGKTRTQGKHVSILCQACKTGVCTYLKASTKYL